MQNSKRIQELEILIPNSKFRLQNLSQELYRSNELLDDKILSDLSVEFFLIQDRIQEYKSLTKK